MKVQCVVVNGQGECASIEMEQRKGVYITGDRKLEKYAVINEIALFSYELLSSKSTIIHFALPQPLNKLICPDPIIICRGDFERPRDLSCAELLRLCKQSDAKREKVANVFVKSTRQEPDDINEEFEEVEDIDEESDDDVEYDGWDESEDDIDQII